MYVRHLKRFIDDGLDQATVENVEQLAKLADAATGRSVDFQLADEYALKIGGRIGTGRCAAGDKPAAAPQGSQRFAPARLANAVDHHIDAAIAHLQDRVRYPVSLIVDTTAGTHFDGAFGLGVARRDDEDPCDHQSGELQAGDRDPSADTDDQDTLAGLQRLLAEQHTPGGEVAGHQRARCDQVGIVGQRHETAARHRYVFGKAAMPMLAHDLHVLAQRLVAGEAIAASVAIRLRKQDGFHARLQAGSRLGLDDLARSFHAHYLRQRVRDPGTVVAHVEIDAIERRRGNPEHGLAGGRDRIGEFPPADAVGAAPFQNRRFHCASPSVSACSNTRLSYSSHPESSATVHFTAGQHGVSAYMAMGNAYFGVAVPCKTSTLANEKAVKAPRLNRHGGYA